MNICEQNLLYRVGNHGIALFTSENSCEPQNSCGRRAKIPKLEGMTIGFAHHVLGPASYASISNMDKNPLHGGIYLTTFTSRSAGEILLID